MAAFWFGAAPVPSINRDARNTVVCCAPSGTETNAPKSTATRSMVLRCMTISSLRSVTRSRFALLFPRTATRVSLRLERPRRQFILETRGEISHRHDFLLPAGASHTHSDRIGIRFAAADDCHVRNLVHLAIAHAVVEGLRAVVEMRPHTARFQPVDDRPREVLDVVSDRNHPHLLRGEPERKCASIVLDQTADEALHRADEHAMQHGRTMR